MSFRVAVFVLFLCVCFWQSRAQGGAECPEQFSTRRCHRFVRLENDEHDGLHDVCEIVPYASGCSVDISCHSLEDKTHACDGINLLLSICSEFGDMDICAEIEENCGSLEDLPACHG